MLLELENMHKEEVEMSDKESLDFQNLKNLV